MLALTHKFAGLGNEFYSHVEPTGFTAPFIVGYNEAAAKLIGFQEAEAVKYLSGNQKIADGDYIASVYAGHQFGSYVPQLGDGRAILIGECNGYEIQLKGSGKTPYSRFGDGRAVLRSCIREYLCSEAMFALGIPTTRAVAVVSGDEDVQRETVEKAAMLTRLAESHIRFGHFEYFYYTGQKEQLKQLVDFVIANYFPGANYEEFFASVVKRTAQLIAKWQAVGFAHGVMNTDNMSILGLTIDYGPFGFMENYEPGFICNHSDYNGRYAFDKQPSIGLWNLFALAQALSDLIAYEKLEVILKDYQPEFSTVYFSLMFSKLGWEGRSQEEVNVLNNLLNLLQENKVDYTNFFYDLNNPRYGFLKTLNIQIKHPIITPKTPNPRYILRNYLAEQAIQKAEAGDYSEVDKLLKILQNPYAPQTENAAYAGEAPEWAKSLEISCSS